MLSCSELPEELLLAFTSRGRLHDLPKNYFLLREGKHCGSIWIILKGLARHFYVDDKGKERNTWFAAENSITTDSAAFNGAVASAENIQLLEDSIVFEIAIQEMKLLVQSHHAFALWYIACIEKFYLSQIDERVFDLQFLDAGARYQKLLDGNPGFATRLSLGNIASYLNITQETLSRIRARR